MINSFKEELYLIYEGPTEEIFIKHLNKLFESKYKIILKNAHGADNIIREYHNIKKKNVYSKVFVMYDLDAQKNIKNIIKTYREKGIMIDKNIIYFINPQFELIFVLCKSDKLYIDKYDIHFKKLYKIDSYNKKNTQLNAIVGQIDEDNIKEMIKKISLLLSKDDNKLRSSNYDLLFNSLYEIEVYRINLYTFFST